MEKLMPFDLRVKGFVIPTLDFISLSCGEAKAI